MSFFLQTASILSFLHPGCISIYNKIANIQVQKKGGGGGGGVVPLSNAILNLWDCSLFIPDNRNWSNKKICTYMSSPGRQKALFEQCSAAFQALLEWNCRFQCLWQAFPPQASPFLSTPLPCQTLKHLLVLGVCWPHLLDEMANESAAIYTLESVFYFRYQTPCIMNGRKRYKKNIYFRHDRNSLPSKDQGSQVGVLEGYCWEQV